MPNYSQIPELRYLPVYDIRSNEHTPSLPRKMTVRAEVKLDGELPPYTSIVQPREARPSTIMLSLPTLYRIQQEIALKTGGVLKP